jgi:hypothetical protein
MRQKSLFKISYPKFTGLALAIILAYLLFKSPDVSGFVSHLGSLSYFGSFLAGILFSFGFTAPFAVGYFITADPSAIWLTGLIGGTGAMISDLLIFKFIKVSFSDEFNRIRKTEFVKNADRLVEKSIGKKIKMYLTYAVAGFLIASPLPDEAGIIVLAGLSEVKAKVLSVISFILNTIGILAILGISRFV